MKKLISVTLGFLLAISTTFAQHAHFSSAGTIEYQKTINMYAIIKRQYSGNGLPSSMGDQLIESFKKSQPQFRNLKSTLVFGDNKTLFTPIKPDVPVLGFNTPITDQINTIFADYTTNIGTTQKNIADATFLVKDSVRKITWKITNETRDIAGYPCRRANGLVLDSVYVVAFYTDKITVPGGPESFNGLPGMIMEVAIPHENITWVATKVTEGEVPATALVAPKKGKPVNNKGLMDFLLGIFGKQLSPEMRATQLKGVLL